VNRSIFRMVLFLAAAFVAFGVPGCSKQQAKNETVADVNGDLIKVTELQEFLGMPGGMGPASGVPEQRKKEALDRLIAGRLLAQEARAQGLDKTDKFRNAIQESEKSAMITAIYRKEVDSKAKVGSDEVQDEAKKMKAADNTLTDASAKMRAQRSVYEGKVRKVQDELIAAAGKEFPSTIDEKMVEKIAGGEAVPDNAVLATAAGENITYEKVKAQLQRMAGMGREGRDLAHNPVAIKRVLTREATGLSLAAYAKKEGIEGSEWLKSTHEEIERSILVDLMVEKVLEGETPPDDKEVEAYYKENPDMFAQHGKTVPLAKVKEQLRGFLRNEKRKSALNAYIEELKKKAKITVNEKALAEI
jgi:hypothetical protein